MKKYLKIIKIFISIGVLALLFYLVDVDALLRQLSEIKIGVVIAAFSILLIQCVLSSTKWKIILSTDRKKVPFLPLLRIYLIGNFISLFLPSSFGGDLYRIYALKEYNTDYLQNTSSVLFDRISGLFALLSISIISFAFFFRNMLDLSVLGIYVMAIVIFWFMTTNWFLTRLEKFDTKLVQFPKNILMAFSRYRRNIPVLISCLGISFLFQSNIVFLNKIYTLALNIDLNLLYLFMVIPLIYLTEALPISINGLGVREGAFVFFMQKAGLTAEQGLALGVIVITMRYIFAISFGGSLFILEMLKTKSNAKKNITEVES